MIGGNPAVTCENDSFCTLNLTRIHGAIDGVQFVSARGRVLSSTVTDNSARGILVANGSVVFTYLTTVGGNGDVGILVAFGSSLTAYVDTIQNNASFGIRVIQRSALQAVDLTITGNGGDGVRVAQAATASFGQSTTGNVITGNGGSGVFLRDLSFAEFDDANNVSGNLTQPDVACNPQYSATRGSGTVGGTTNCLEPQQSPQPLLPHTEGNGLPERR